MSHSLWPHGLQHPSPPSPSPFPESAQTLVHWISDAIQPSRPLLPPSLSALNLYQHQGLFQWVSSSHLVARKYWSFSFFISPSNEYSGLISFRINWFRSCCLRDSQESSPTPQFESINSSALCLLYGPSLISVRDYGKDHSFDCTYLCEPSDVFAF